MLLSGWDGIAKKTKHSEEMKSIIENCGIHPNIANHIKTPTPNFDQHFKELDKNIRKYIEKEYDVQVDARKYNVWYSTKNQVYLIAQEFMLKKDKFPIHIGSLKNGKIKLKKDAIPNEELQKKKE